MDKKVSKLQWMDYLNSRWLKDGMLQNYYTRAGVQNMFDMLIENKEVTYTSSSSCQENETLLFDFEKGYPTLEEQQHYNQKLLENQVKKVGVI